jgi:alpha/beta superfamily hydrolase
MYGAVDKLRALVATVPGENRIAIVEDADHFFVGKLDQVDAAIASWMKETVLDPRKRS